VGHGSPPNTFDQKASKGSLGAGQTPVNETGAPGLLGILSGSHADSGRAARARAGGRRGARGVGGIIPPADEAALREAGVARVDTRKDFEVSRIMGDIVDVVADHHGVAAIP
jgi:methylmalonyl-CoA mutase cobalamin-binding subunit